MCCYLHELESIARYSGYNFNYDKIVHSGPEEFPAMTVTKEQLRYEASWLKTKLLTGKRRNIPLALDLEIALQNDQIRPHPLFEVIEGPIEKWEKVK
jgi:hypothetical protein